MAAAQYDSWQLSHLVHGYDGLENRPTYTAAEKQYAEAWNSGSCVTPILVKCLADFIVPVTVHSKCNSLFFALLQGLCSEDSQGVESLEACATCRFLLVLICMLLVCSANT